MDQDWSTAEWRQASQAKCRTGQCAQIARRGDRIALRSTNAPDQIAEFTLDELAGLKELVNEQLA